MGLNQDEKELLQGIRNDDIYTTTGNKIWKILHDNQEEQVMQDALNFTLKSINNRFN